jgi:uracil-DNA glycosylase
MNKYLDKIHPDWDIILNTEQLNDILKHLTKLTDIIYPPPEHIFRAFCYKPPSEIKVIILGQDCYHQKNQATGLCFGINNNCRIPPSLKNIQKELLTDVNTKLTDFSLNHWAEQGVLLLNSSLTVIDSKPGSHLPLWKDYTDNIIKYMSDTYPNLVFVLWGKKAQTKIKLINSNNNHLILKCNHPSPLSANKGGWFGNCHFSKINTYLLNHNIKEIKW